MAYSGFGDFAFGAGTYVGLGYAGRIANGDGTVTAGVYSLTGLEVANGLAAPPTVVTGSLTLTNSSTDVSVEQPGNPGFDGRVIVGRGQNNDSVGTLTIENGATLTSTNNAFFDNGAGSTVGGYGNVRIGISEPYAGTGAVNVDGLGSRLIADGGSARITIGQGANGIGTLNITNGGYVGTHSLNTGRQNNAAAQTSTVNIDGAGSELRISASFGQYLNPTYSGTNGYTTFGRDGGKGELIVQNGGSLIQENVDGLTDGGQIRFGRNNGDYGYGVIRDAGSSVVVRQIGAIGDSYSAGSEVRVGSFGHGVLKVESGATLSILGANAELQVARGDFNGSGSETSAQSLLEITGGSRVLVDSQTYTGSVQSGAGFYNGAQLRIASGVNANGKVVVDGAGSRLDVVSLLTQANDYSSGQLRVGNLGAGYLEVSNSAIATTSELEVATFSRGIDTTGSEITSFNYLATVIDGSYGKVDITTGGSIVVTAGEYSPYRGVRAGLSTGSFGIINVDGSGSSLTSTGGAGLLSFGRYGSGTLNITDGGTVSGFFGEAGRERGGLGYINVDGAGSKLVLSDAYGTFRGTNSSGTVNYAGEAGFLRLGREDGSRGELRITAGGEVEITNDPTDIKDIPALNLGRNAGSAGYLLVDGDDGAGNASQLNIAMTGSAIDAFSTDGSFYAGPELTLGDSRDSAAGGGAGTVVVQNGGEINLTGEDAFLGIGLGSSNTAYAYTSSSVTIQSGGRINLSSIGNEAAAFVTIGRQDTGVGSLLIDGPGSELRISSDNVDDVTPTGEDVFGAGMAVGFRGQGTLNVQNGGSLVIDGADDRFPALIIGRGDSNAVSNAVGMATLTGAGSTIDIIGNNATHGALLSVGSFDGATGSFSVLDGGVVTLSTTGTSAVAIGPNTGGNGSVMVSGAGSLIDAGTLLLLAADRDNDTLEILPDAGGTGSLTISNGGEVSAELTTIGREGVLNLSGDILHTTGAARLENHGTINVGGSGTIGIGGITGDFDNQLNGDVVFEVNGFSAGQFDVLNLSSGAGINLAGPGITVDVSGLSTASVGDSAVILNATDFVLPTLTLSGFELIGQVGQIVFDLVQTGDQVELVAASESVTGTSSAETISGSNNADALDGLEGGDILDGLDGPDLLSGGAGDDDLRGGNGDDTLEGGADSDVIDGGSGIDTASYASSGVGVSVNLGSGSAIGGDAAGDTLISVENVIGSGQTDTITGDGQSNTLTGLDGNDQLNGGAGADVMDGGLGNDRFFVDDAGDVVIEGVGEGTDLVSTSVNFVLPEHVENGSTLGTGDVAITGNGLANFITGNGGANLLRGAGGADRLIAGLGNDTLEGGSGNDLLQGQGGADRFVVTADNGDDQILDWEVSGDVLDFGALGLRFVDLAITSSGNEALITFDDPAGGTGSIRLAGIDPEALETGLMADPGGVGAPGGIPLTAGTSGADNLAATNGDDDVVGLAGNDILNGRAGADTMVGGFGDDRYFLDDAGDLAVELQFQGTDQMDASFSFTLAEHVERGAVLGGGAVDITGNALGNFITGSALSNVLRGEDGRDRLIGFDGDDTLIGGLDNDVLEGGLGADVFVFEADSGIDLITDFEVGVDLIDVTAIGISFADMTIIDGALGARVIFDLVPGSVDLVTVQGVAAADLRLATFFGAPNDPIVGTSGDDVLFGTVEDDELQGLGGSDLVDGRAGADVMIGGPGDDRYFVDDAGDVVTELPGEGTDQVTTSVDFTLPDNVENGSVSGSGDVALTGNALANALTGNVGGDTLSGEGGSDNLQGLAGADTIDGGPGGDVLRGGADADTFLFDTGDGQGTGDQILDFEIGLDTVDLSATGLSFADLTITDTGSNTTITYGADIITVFNVSAAQLGEEQFVFA